MAPRLFGGGVADPVAAAYKSARLRSSAASQRRALRNRSPREFVHALLNPPPELASLPLGRLLAPSTCSERPIPRFGPERFENTLRLLHRRGNVWADPHIRLRQLNRYQRRQLIEAIFLVAPIAWRDSL